MGFSLLFPIRRLPQLKMLDVSFNSIVKLPEEIGSAASLVKYAVFFRVNFSSIDWHEKVDIYLHWYLARITWVFAFIFVGLIVQIIS